MEPLRRRLSLGGLAGQARVEPRELAPSVASPPLLPSSSSAVPSALALFPGSSVSAPLSSPASAALLPLPSSAALAAPPRAPRVTGGTKRPASGGEVEPPCRRLALAPRPRLPFCASEGAGGQAPHLDWMPAPDHRVVAGVVGVFQAAGPSGTAGPAPGGRRAFDAAPHTATPPRPGRAAGAGGGAASSSAPFGRSRSARRAPCGARLPAPSGAFGSGQVHSLFCVAASMVCLACGRVFTVEAARGPGGVPCSWSPFCPPLRFSSCARRGPLDCWELFLTVWSAVRRIVGVC